MNRVLFFVVVFSAFAFANSVDDVVKEIVALSRGEITATDKGEIRVSTPLSADEVIGYFAENPILLKVTALPYGLKVYFNTSDRATVQFAYWLNPDGGMLHLVNDSRAHWGRPKNVGNRYHEDRANSCTSGNGRTTCYDSEGKTSYTVRCFRQIDGDYVCQSKRH